MGSAVPPKQLHCGGESAVQMTRKSVPRRIVRYRPSNAARKIWDFS